MYIKNKTLSILWKAILLIAGCWGLLDGSGILAGNYTSDFPHMFTNLSNLFAWIYFACAILWLIARRRDPEGSTFAPVVKYNATMALLVTMLIAHFMLFDAMFQDGHLVWHLVVLHYMVPLMALLDWLLFDKKGRMPVWGPPAWVLFAVGYLIFTLVGVGLFGLDMGGGTTSDITRYPYTFLDPAIAGVGGVAGFCGAMVAAFIILGYVLYGIDRLLGKRKQRM